MPFPRKNLKKRKDSCLVCKYTKGALQRRALCFIFSWQTPKLLPGALGQVGVDIVDHFHGADEQLDGHLSVVGGGRREIVLHIDIVTGIQIQPPESVAGLEMAQQGQNLSAFRGGDLDQIEDPQTQADRSAGR